MASFRLRALLNNLPRGLGRHRRRLGMLKEGRRLGGRPMARDLVRMKRALCRWEILREFLFIYTKSGTASPGMDERGIWGQLCLARKINMYNNAGTRDVVDVPEQGGSQHVYAQAGAPLQTGSRGRCGA
jgi:hypothetical protein